MLTGDIRKLADILTPADENSDSDEDVISPSAKVGPGSIGPKKQESAQETKTDKPAHNTKDIWAAEEVAEGAEYDDVYDTRQVPDYDIVYKQAVTSEDMFLQMGNKTPATSSCEDMIVKIQLPDTKMADVQLDVKDKFIDCRTPKYKLGLHLPHPVDSKNGRAQWEEKSETLSITLKMKREYDFANF